MPELETELKTSVLKAVVARIGEINDIIRPLEKNGGISGVQRDMYEMKESLKQIYKLLDDHSAKHMNMEKKENWSFVGVEEDSMIFKSEHGETRRIDKKNVVAILTKDYTEVPYGSAQRDVEGDLIPPRLENFIRVCKDARFSQSLGLDVKGGVDSEAVETTRESEHEKIFVDALKAVGGELEEKKLMDSISLTPDEYYDVKMRMHTRGAIRQTKVRGKQVVVLV